MVSLAVSGKRVEVQADTHFGNYASSTWPDRMRLTAVGFPYRAVSQQHLYEN